MESKRSIEIWPNGSRASTRASSENFTGSVVVDPLFGASDHMHTTGGVVSFEPGARTAWHRHPAGQILVVTSGTGWVQEWQSSRRQLQPGDVVWIPPDVKHWHGATATNRMSHIAITNIVDGTGAVWMEQVSDEEHESA
jgi:quercetin dioxygenase-like cupin family protein